MAAPGEDSESESPPRLRVTLELGVIVKVFIAQRPAGIMSFLLLRRRRRHEDFLQPLPDPCSSLLPKLQHLQSLLFVPRVIPREHHEEEPEEERADHANVLVYCAIEVGNLLLFSAAPVQGGEIPLPLLLLFQTRCCSIINHLLGRNAGDTVAGANNDQKEEQETHH